MYSVVLMAALSTGGEMPAFGHRGGCCGCYGGCWGGCYGCSGCWGGGCWGGGCRGWHGGCRGGWGGCWGCSGCWGCGGCYGGWGGHGYALATYGAPVVMTASASPSAETIMASTPADSAKIIATARAPAIGRGVRFL